MLGSAPRFSRSSTIRGWLAAAATRRGVCRSQERSVWASSTLPSENQESRPPDPLPSDPGVQALSPHLALMLTNVQMSVHLEHLSCGVRGPAQPSSRKQVQEPEDRWKAAMSTAPQLNRGACRFHPLYSRVSLLILGQQLLWPQSQHVSTGSVQGWSVDHRRQLWGS